MSESENSQAVEPEPAAPAEPVADGSAPAEPVPADPAAEELPVVDVEPVDEAPEAEVEVEAEPEGVVFAGEDFGTDVSLVGGSGHSVSSEGIDIPEEIDGLA